ncbi:GNAT family N-acetyltransferase [bacterium]|nr:GNAT family N-acetyltransferase [bacterium]
MIKAHKIIEASIDDIPTLVLHHRRMFEEIWRIRKLELDEQKLKDMDDAYSNKLNEEIITGTCKAWIAKIEDKITTSGAVSIISMVPNPSDSSYKVAYMHSIFTVNEFRNRGIAELVVKRMLVYCKSRNINRVILVASEAGRSIYEKIGFKNNENSMSINVNDLNITNAYTRPSPPFVPHSGAGG